MMGAAAAQIDETTPMTGKSIRRQDDPVKRAQIAEKCKNTNINSQSLLATDYLNHFNEIIMLLEMMPTMQEVFEDISAWEPKSYCAHFEQSGFSDKELAIEAYDHVPEPIFRRFNHTVQEMNLTVKAVVRALRDTLEEDNREMIAELCKSQSIELMCQIDRLSAIINGKTIAHTKAQSPSEPEQPDSVGHALFVADTLFGG